LENKNGCHEDHHLGINGQKVTPEKDTEVFFLLFLVVKDRRVREPTRQIRSKQRVSEEELEVCVKKDSHFSSLRIKVDKKIKLQQN
jgi:hypothetical protein